MKKPWAVSAVLCHTLGYRTEIWSWDLAHYALFDSAASLIYLLNLSIPLKALTLLSVYTRLLIEESRNPLIDPISLTIPSAILLAIDSIVPVESAQDSKEPAKIDQNSNHWKALALKIAQVGLPVLAQALIIEKLRDPLTYPISLTTPTAIFLAIDSIGFIESAQDSKESAKADHNSNHWKALALKIAQAGLPVLAALIFTPSACSLLGRKVIDFKIPLALICFFLRLNAFMKTQLLF
ncbi:MAG: hypothetical protein AAF443_03580 [Chlamydiota bacterium]